MNMHNSTSQPKTWERPSRAPEAGGNKSQADVDLWRELIERIIVVGNTYGWTKAEVARRIGMPDGTFSQYYSAKYEGRLDGLNEKVAQWLDALQEMAGIAATIPQSPAYMPLRGSLEIIETLTWAQINPDLVMITLGAGMGKTATCRQFTRTRPHVYHATITESTKTVHGMLVELAEQLEVREHNPARLARAIGNRVRRTGGGSLLIVDEGQHLDDAALNQLRYFVDVYECGVAVVGNSEVYSRFTKHRTDRSYAQLKSRIGKRLHRTQPYEEDLAACIAAWNVTDAGCVKFLTGVGMKGGAFRQIDKTMRMATMAAIGEGSNVELRHIQSAWKMRDVEDMA
jgi:DNA transposition AAA+ family ATPase